MSVTNVVGKQVIDLASDANYYFEIAPQGDSQARYVDVTLVQNGASYHIPSGSTAILEGKNAGGYNIFNPCSISPTQDDLITIPLTNGVLSFAGIGRYSVGIYNGSNYILSFSFNIVVTEAPYDIIALQASDQYEALNQIIAKAADSNRWVVADEAPPSVASADTHVNDYYLDGSNGNVYYAYDNPSTGNIEWVPVENPTTHKQLNIMAKTYVRYATDSSGSNFSPDPVAGGIVRNYIGFLSTVNVENPLDPSLDINTPSAYTWASMSTGISSTESKYLVLDTYSPTPPADTEPWSTGWPSTMVPGGYMWIKTRVTFTDNTYAEYYTVTKNGRSVDHMELLKDDGDISGGEKTFRFIYDGNDYYLVTPLGTENPQALGWYIQNGGNYVLTTDTAVQTGTSYYTKGEQTQNISVFNGTGAGFDTPDISIVSSPGKPQASIHESGPNSSKKFDFDFEIRGSHWKSGTDIDGTTTGIISTTYTNANTIVGDMYLNKSTGNIYICSSVTDVNSTWDYNFSVGYITNIDDLNNTRRYYGVLQAGQSHIQLTNASTAPDSMYTPISPSDTWDYQWKCFVSKFAVSPMRTSTVTIGNGTITIDLDFKEQTSNMDVCVEIIKKNR